MICTGKAVTKRDKESRKWVMMDYKKVDVNLSWLSSNKKDKKPGKWAIMT